LVVSIHADDEFSLRFAIECELDDVLPRDGLAAVVIARHRKVRRRRIAGAVGLVVAFAGIGVPLGLTSSGQTSSGLPSPGGGAAARTSPVVLRLASYSLKLPGKYRPISPKAVPCASAVASAGASLTAVSPAGASLTAASSAAPRQAVAAATSSGCVVMLLTPRAQGAPAMPRDAQPVTAGRYQAWLVPPQRAGAVADLVIEEPGQVQDLVISASGLDQTALVALARTDLVAMG
jgi:hypothetical protein